MKKIQIILLFVLLFGVLFSQNNNKVDSLKNLLTEQKADSEKVKILFKIALELENKMQDSTEAIFNQIIQICDKQKVPEDFFTKFKAHSDFKLGYCYFEKGNYPAALEKCLSALKVFEKFGMVKEQAYATRQLGQINHYQSPESFGDARNWYRKSMTLMKKAGDILGFARVERDLGSLFSDPISQAFYNVDSAIFYCNKAYEVISKYGTPEETAGFDLNIAWILAENGKPDEAMKKINQSLEYYTSIQHEFGIFASLRSKAYVLAIKEEYEKSEQEYLKALEIAQKLGNLDAVNNIYESLSYVKSDQKDYKKALEYYKLSVETKFKMYSQERINSMAEMKTKYETEKKELQIENLHKERELQNKVVEKQMILIYSFVLGFVIVLVFSVIITRQYRQKKAANIKLAKQNIEISQQKEEISAQRDEIEAQRDEISKHRDIVVAQKDEIESSINYAQRIQKAVLPSDELLNMFLSDYFVLFRPKDIVSGDFYWATLIKNWQIVTVADCTGHGVPGAFMSMLGISFLNEIVRKQEITKASDVLNHLRKSVIESLKQTGESGTQKDGMDLSLCVINIEENMLQWAGANNPLWIVRKIKVESHAYQQAGQKGIEANIETLSTIGTLNTQGTSNLDKPSTFELYELKGDKMPIAIYERMDEFTNHELQLTLGDQLYMMSDGYEDQFGGPKQKKFLSKNLKQLLIENCRLNMNEQKAILEKTLVDWIGDGEQIDDITVLGIKI